MKWNALKIATGLIALLIVTLLYELASTSEALLTNGVGFGVLIVGFVFRRTIFRTAHRVVEDTLMAQGEKIFGVSQPDKEFDAQAAIERHVAGREGEAFDVDAAFDRYMGKREAGAIDPPASPTFGDRASRPAFGRKGL